MATFLAAKKEGAISFDDQTKDNRDLVTQSILSIAFGLSAFLAFCVSAFYFPILLVKLANERSS